LTAQGDEQRDRKRGELDLDTCERVESGNCAEGGEELHIPAANGLPSEHQIRRDSASECRCKALKPVLETQRGRVGERANDERR
jgi:hypothetical protein